MKRIWHYLSNQFQVATKKNYKKAVKLSTEHYDRLAAAKEEHSGDPDYAEAFERYKPFHDALVAAYQAWKSQGGMQKGDTLNVEQLLALLPGKVNKWDSKIQDVHDKDSPRYMQLFPQAHKPFYRGSQDSRINAVGQLSLTIGTEVALAAVKLLVDGANEELVAAKAEQTGAKEVKKEDSSEVEVARVQAMTAQYQNLGFFINKYPAEPNKIEPLFDVETLSRSEQTIWTGTLDPGEKYPTLINTFSDGDMMQLKSTGEAGVKAYLASTPGGTDSIAVSVESMLEKTFDVKDFGVTDYATHRYLTICNQSETIVTSFLVELY
jgi:hypothetical protein